MYKLLFHILKIGKKSSLSETKRSQIVVLRKGGYSERETSAKICCSKIAVHTGIANFNNYYGSNIFCGLQVVLYDLRPN